MNNTAFTYEELKQGKSYPKELTLVPEYVYQEYPFPDQAPNKFWLSRKFAVQLYECPSPEHPDLKRLSIHRNKRNRSGWVEGITWDELQSIKSEIGFGDWYAIEIYPRNDDVINVANIRHLWLLKQPLTIGWFKMTNKPNIKTCPFCGEQYIHTHTCTASDADLWHTIRYAVYKHTDMSALKPASLPHQVINMNENRFNRHQEVKQHKTAFYIVDDLTIPKYCQECAKDEEIEHPQFIIDNCQMSTPTFGAVHNITCDTIGWESRCPHCNSQTFQVIDTPTPYTYTPPVIEETPDA